MEEQIVEPGKKGSRKGVWRFIKFALFSVSAGLIQIGSFTLLKEVVHLEPWWSYLISLILSVLWNFTLNRKFTFKSANNVPIAMLKVALYYCVFTPLSTWWTKALNLAGWNAYVVEIGTMVINFLTEFLFCQFVVYRGSMDTNDLAKKQAEKSSAEHGGADADVLSAPPDDGGAHNA